VNLLLDTHVFLWWDQRSPILNPRALDTIEDAGNNVFVSAASVWEIAIKRRRGKLAFTGSVSAAIAANGFLELPILPPEAEAAGDLAWQHEDPFDRMLVAQAIGQRLVLITGDATIRDLDSVAQIWAR
jgi:PIN domain nuclease of toxin-antitoxin system